MKKGLSLTELAAEIDRRAAAKKDMIVPAKHMEMATDGKHLVIANRESFGVNKIAHEQLATAVEIPKKYYDRMLKDAPELLARNVNEWLHRQDDKRMVRTLFGDVRALLSDRYRPLENEDLAQATLPVLLELGLDVMSSQITDSRLYIKAVDPKVTRELQAKGGAFGDGQHNIVRVLAPAITISNSEVGQGAMSVLGGVYDGFCSNLATFGERSTRKYHVGARHEIGEETYALLSEETRRKTDVATWAQVADVVRGAFNRAHFDSLCDKIAETQNDKITDPVEVVRLTSSRFSLTETVGKAILQHLVEGADLSRFGLYNAVTRAAQDVDDYDDATAMERIGAQIIELPRNQWQEIGEPKAKAA